MRILLQAFLSFENGSFKSLWLKFQKAVSLPKILENPQTLCINMKCVIYIETGLCLIFVEIYRLGDIRLGLNSIVEFNSVFFWFDSLVKVSCLPKGHIVTAFSLVQLLSCVWLFETPWIAEHQAFCPSPTPRACLNSCPLSQWCYPTISASVALFSCPQTFLALGSYPMSQLFKQGEKSQKLWPYQIFI